MTSVDKVWNPVLNIRECNIKYTGVPVTVYLRNKENNGKQKIEKGHYMKLYIPPSGSGNSKGSFVIKTMRTHPRDNYNYYSSTTVIFELIDKIVVGVDITKTIFPIVNDVIDKKTHGVIEMTNIVTDYLGHYHEIEL